MPQIPRALVIAPVIDGKAMIAALDAVVSGFSGRGVIKAQITNSATTESGGQTWSLFAFLDEGTKPHYIDDDGEVMGNILTNFGPVWGPLFHPGTRPYDITARVSSYFEAKLAQLVDVIVPDTGTSISNRVPWESFRNVTLLALRSALDFAVTITPDNWHRVKASYKLTVNGRSVDD